MRPGTATNACTTLAPRQAATSAPYAVRAANFSGQVSASQITGTLSSANIAPGSITPAPSPRSRHTAVWTGSELIVWGGQGPTDAPAGDGGRYFPAQNAWVPTAGGPISYSHSAVWTGSRTLLWGGADGQQLLTRLWSYQPTPPLVLYQKP